MNLYVVDKNTHVKLCRIISDLFRGLSVMFVIFRSLDGIENTLNVNTARDARSAIAFNGQHVFRIFYFGQNPIDKNQSLICT